MECERSSQLPRKIGSGYGAPAELKQISEQYEKHGIKVVGESNGDPLFVDVKLPEGWEIKGTGHSMWNEVLDNNGRVRATFFYKAAFYDRDAFLHFETRYKINTITYLPSEEKGHYETRTVKVEVEQSFRKNMRLVDYGLGEDNRFYEFEDGNGNLYRESCQKMYEEKEEKFWVPKYKDHYAEIKNTPMYFEVLDGKEVIYSNKSNPIFFTKKHQENYHSKWWNEYEDAKKQLWNEAKKYLDSKYPEWQDTTKHF